MQCLQRPLRACSKQFRRFINNEEAASAVEYAVVLALIVIVCVYAVMSLGQESSATYSDVAGGLGGADDGNPDAGG